MVRLVPESLPALTSEEVHGGAVGTGVEHASVLLEHCANRDHRGDAKIGFGGGTFHPIRLSLPLEGSRMDLRFGMLIASSIRVRR
jgi:hypothetical protein